MSCRHRVSEGNASLSAAASLYTRATTSTLSRLFSSFSFFTFPFLHFFIQKTQDSAHLGVFAKQKLCPLKLLRFATQNFRLLELPAVKVETLLLDPYADLLGLG